jgi:tryptophan synthase alpha chain
VASFATRLRNWLTKFPARVTATGGVGFGIRTPEQAGAVARAADAAAVGSSLALNPDGAAKAELVGAAPAEVRALAQGVRNARRKL